MSTPTRVAASTLLSVGVSAAPVLFALAFQSAAPDWSPTIPLLHPRSAHALVSTPTSLYALACTSSSGTPVLPVEVERFDAATSTWSLETTLPGDGLNATAAVVLDNRILLVGGFNTTTNVPTAQVLAYDLSTHA